MTPIHILVTLDENYLPPLRVMLTSLFVNNPGEKMEVWMLHSSIPEIEINNLRKFCENYNAVLHPLQVDDSLWGSAPANSRYPQEMYFRLLAPRLLPDALDRVLYLDPDILIINPLRPLWDLDMQGFPFAAAAHTGKTEFANDVNRIRLSTEHDYFNSGVLLIDLVRGRKENDPQKVFRYAEEHKNELLLPDQDILNGLYGSRILELNDAVWNYDARNYSSYFFRSAGQANIDWVMQNTAILHFCGGAKPWKPLYCHRFGILYKHYMQVAARGFKPDYIIKTNNLRGG